MPSGVYKNPRRGPDGKQLRGLATASPGTRTRVSILGGKAQQARKHPRRWDYWEARWQSSAGVEARRKRR